jgi:hypothetical protein
MRSCLWNFGLFAHLVKKKKKHEKKWENTKEKKGRKKKGEGAMKNI